ncbi:MAG TPA: hypothetical protein VLI91_03980 [Roseiarcus sp.]|nr:hypothetical protein [Roseiarcus sp.]
MTGGAGGVGSAIRKALATAGAVVAVGYNAASGERAEARTKAGAMSKPAGDAPPRRPRGSHDDRLTLITEATLPVDGNRPLA